MGRSSSITLFLACLFLLSLLASTASAALTPIFGPESYVRGSGQPVTVLNTFPSAYPGESCLLQVYNGGLKNSEFELVSSSTIALNGSQVISPNEFNQQVTSIEKPVILNASNEIAIEVRGQPGGGIVVQVACERDVIPPTIEATLSSLPNGAGWHQQDVTVSFVCDDAESGVASCPAPVLVAIEGVGQVISGEASDHFGNTASTSVTINLDKSAPQISAAPLPIANLFGWNNGDVTVAFSCSDALSSIVLCPADLLVSSEGAAQSVNGTVVDIAGNSASVTHTLNIDKTAPLITPTLSTPADLNGWHHSDVTVSFDCSDAMSGITTCTSPQLINSEGANQLISGSAEDKSGHSAHADVTINLDKFAPTISATPTPLPNSNGWHNSDVNITYDCSDSGAGIETCTGPVLLTTEGAGLTTTGTATDLAGKSTSLTTTVNLDNTAPQITASVTPVANAAGWHNSAVSIAYSCTDALSGIDTCPTTTTISTDGAGQGINGTATDIAGNSATTSVTLNIDQTAPVVEVTAPLDGSTVTDASLTITGTASDANQIAAFTINGSSVMMGGNGAFSHAVTLVNGINLFSVQAVDIAGNETTVTLNVNYDPPPLISDLPSLTVGDGNGTPGEVMMIPLNYISDGTVTTLQVDLLFDAAQLSAGQPTAGAALGTSHGLATSQPQAGVLRIVITPPSDNAPLAAGVITTVPFTINTTASNGTPALTLSNSVMADGTATEMIPEALTHGLITISGAL